MKSLQWIVVSISALVIVLAASSGFSRPQEEQKAEQPQVIGGLAFKDEVQVTVVNVDVFVRDKKGQPVIGLDRGDFRILQDGEERPISHFAPYTEEVVAQRAQPSAPLPAPTPTPASPAEEPSGARQNEIKPIYIVFYVDSENLRPFDRNRVLSQTRRFLREVMYPHVQVMVVSYHRSLDIVVPFTHDPDAVMNGLHSLYKMTGAREQRDSERNRILRDLQRLKERGTVHSARQASSDVWTTQGDIQSYAEETANDLSFALQALREITTSLSGFPGRRWLVYISDGLPMIPGRDLFHDFSQTYQSASSLGFMMKYDQSRRFDALASAANAQGVSFLTIDASGLGGENRASAEYIKPIDPVTATIDLNNNQETLQMLADRTGGRAILGANDISDGLDAFRKDLFSYYSLGYKITATGGDRVHQIEVELPSHPEYDLSYRRSFVEKSAESKVQDTVVTGLMYDLDSNPLGMEASTGPAAPAAGDRWLVPLTVQLPLQSVALIPQGDEYVGHVLLIVGARSPDGRQSDLQQTEHDVRMAAADYASHRGDHVSIEVKLLMEEGPHRIAVGVMDRLSRQSAYQTLSREVPGPR